MDIKLIEQACSVALSDIGVIMKRRIGHFPINDDFVGWIGLNAGQHKDFTRINPFIGVHCPKVMKMVALAAEEKYRPNESATYSVFLGTLCPEIEQFIFTDEIDISAEAKRLASKLKEFGVPYMHSLANYSILLPLLKKRVPVLGGYPQRYAAALLLSGNYQKYIDFIESQIVVLRSEGVPEVITALEKIKELAEKERVTVQPE